MEPQIQQATENSVSQSPKLRVGLALALTLVLSGCIFESSGSSGGDSPTPPPPPPPPPDAVIGCKDYNFNDVEVQPKTVTVHNNSDRRLYPVLATSTNEVNQWLQGCFRTADLHPTERVYKLYVNEGEGLPPNSSVTITLPLYSRLAEESYITWWNGGRVVLADKDDRLRNPDDKEVIDPVGLSCRGENTACALTTYSSNEQFHENVFAQLSEYTFGDSVEVAGQQVRLLKPENVGYNISYVDHVYMPVAIGPKSNPYIGYSGSVQTLPEFQTHLTNFLASGSVGEGWPVYNLGDTDHLKLPGGYNIFAQRGGYLIDDNGVPVKVPGFPPPVLTVLRCLEENCTDDEKKAGDGTNGLRFEQAVQRMQNLWGSCVDWGAEDISKYVTSTISCDQTLKDRMQAVTDFFAQNHANYLAMYGRGECEGNTPQKPKFNYWEALVHVYGWVPFNEGCGAAANPLVATQIPNWDHAEIQSMYIHNLQYNHLAEAKNDPNLLFNPYVQLIHDSLKMNAYAFSVDDAVGFMSELGSGLNFVVGGEKGLENPQQFSYADGFSVAIGVDSDMAGRPTTPIIKKYGVCVIGNGQNCDQIEQDVIMPTNNLIAGFRVGTVAGYPIKVRFTDMDDNVYTFEVERKFTECPVDTPFETCNENNKDVLNKAKCTVVDTNGATHPKSTNWCDTANPNQAKDEKAQHLTKNYISFGVPVNYLP
ncbi:hypothetical protein [Pusillimonas sp.]|uniref:hypothetical protein n=1 Tax=Pusillimonas sp. TaxID=3040095 RepID=UPI0037CA8267